MSINLILLSDSMLKKKSVDIFYENSSRTQIVTFSSGQKGCDFYELSI